PQHEKITGLSTDFIKGKKPEDVLPAKVAMKVRNRYAECVNSKQTIAYEEWLPFKGKQTYWETILNPQINETGNVFQIIGTSQDISERKHSEQLVQEKSEEIAAQNEELNQANMALVAAKEKAEENEKLFKSVIENAPDGVVIINEHGNFK
ncbi:PAS domain S-box protein, partial [Arthrospira platensis SPKY1]|nr:PAS domain S-box protein [Arthrospira platensis SPKY1]